METVTVFYSLVGEDGEDPAHPNMFRFSQPTNKPVTLSDIKTNFPMVQYDIDPDCTMATFDYSFQTANVNTPNAFRDLISDDMEVPKFGGRIIMRIHEREPFEGATSNEFNYTGGLDGLGYEGEEGDLYATALRLKREGQKRASVVGANAWSGMKTFASKAKTLAQQAKDKLDEYNQDPRNEPLTNDDGFPDPNPPAASERPAQERYTDYRDGGEDLGLGPRRRERNDERNYYDQRGEFHSSQSDQRRRQLQDHERYGDDRDYYETGSGRRGESFQKGNYGVEGDGLGISAALEGVVDKEKLQENMQKLGEAATEGYAVAKKKMWGGLSALSKTLTETSQVLKDTVVASAGSILLENITLERTTVILEKQVAEGGFSVVFACRDTETGQEYALKKMICQEREMEEAARNEIRVHRRINSPYVMDLIDSVVRPSEKNPRVTEVYLLFPLFSRGSLWDLLYSVEACNDPNLPWPFTEEQILRNFIAICRGVAAVHKVGLAHRDIKPHNVLIANDGRPVLMDLGSCKQIPIEVTSFRQATIVQEEADMNCSMPYRAPELTEVPSSVRIDERVDVWSLGCLLYCMAFGWSPFESPTQGVQKLGILNGRYTFPRDNYHNGNRFSDAFVNLIKRILTTDPATRIYLDEVMTLTESIVLAM